MASYVLSEGLDQSAVSIEEITQLLAESLDDIAQSDEKLTQLATNHAILAEIVKPATPGGLSLLQKQEMNLKNFKWLGRTRLIQVISIFSMVAIFTLIIILSQNNFARGDLRDPVESITLVIVSYLGASFLLLYQANDNAVKGKYDPKYGSTYFIRILLGIIAGVLLAEIIPQFQGDDISDLPKIVLALIGGFSVNVVYRILVRVSESVESLFRGSMKSVIEAQVEANRLQHLSQSIQMRQAIASKLIALSGELPEQQKQQINELADQIITGLL